MATDPRATAQGIPRRQRLAESTRANALRFVVLIGVVSLFGDMTYEASRGINGPFLAVLGAGAAAVGVISGSGELLGYGVRLVSGTLAGRSGRYWLWTGAGYLVNLLAVPALAGSWQLAAVLIIVERVGKGLRNPLRDTMLSFAGSVLGQGWAFALREALDQAGAMIGPLRSGSSCCCVMTTSGWPTSGSSSLRRSRCWCSRPADGCSPAPSPSSAPTRVPRSARPPAPGCLACSGCT